MTLAFALRGIDGLVLGADSRSSNSEGSTDTSTKFLQINREIGVLTYGLTEVGHIAIHDLLNEVNRTNDFTTNKQRIVYFSEIAKTAQNTFKRTFDDWVKRKKSEIPDLHPNYPGILTGFVLAGYDGNESNQFRVLSWNSPDFQPQENPSIIAAQWHISQYLNNHLYFSEMNVELLKRLAVFMFVETANVSPTVGGQLQLATVTLENGFQRLHEREIQNLMNENQPRFSKFQRILLNYLRKD